MKRNMSKVLMTSSVAIFLLVWAYINAKNNSFFLVWGALITVGVLGIKQVFIDGYKPDNKWLNLAFSLLFAVIVVAGNTPLGQFFVFHGGIGKIVLAIFLALGGFAAFSGALIFVEHLELTCVGNGRKSLSFFIVPFIIISVINILVLTLCRFPGIIDEDSKVVLSQIYGANPYTNHHSFFYTLILKLFLDIFKTPNIAIFIFCVIQILFVASCMAYSIYTLNELGFSNRVCIFAFATYALYPMFVDYSFFVSKDVPFACFMLLSVICITRVVHYKDISRAYYLLLILSFVGVGVFRSNGIFVCVLTTVVALCLLRKNKLLIRSLWVAILVTLFMKRGVLGMAGVSQPDILEALAIPMQQVTRVCVDNPQSLTPEHIELISEIIDMDSIYECYNSEWVDFIKAAIREKGNLQYFEANRAEYLKMYISLGVKNPGAYIKAWICQTRGYWFTKDSFTITYPGVAPNEWGIYSRPIISSWEKAYDKVFIALARHPLAKHLTCIAVFVWMNLLFTYKALCARNKSAILISTMSFSVFLTLYISAPLDAEYRYIFASVVMMPFVACIALRENTTV